MNRGGEREIFELSLDKNHFLSCTGFSSCISLWLSVNQFAQGPERGWICIVLAKEYDCPSTYRCRLDTSLNRGVLIRINTGEGLDLLYLLITPRVAAHTLHKHLQVW